MKHKGLFFKVKILNLLLDNYSENLLSIVI